MSRLNDLYKAMETLRKEGASTEDLEQKVGSLEEDIIKKEILHLTSFSENSMKNRSHPKVASKMEQGR